MEMNIQEIVNLPEWQTLRVSLVGTWKKTPIANTYKIMAFLGDLENTPNRKLKIIHNYLTGSGFRLGVIKHPLIDKLLSEVKAEVDSRRQDGRYPY